MPNLEVIAKWADALESGEFGQCTNKLRHSSSNEMCCLGVLSELYRREHPEASWDKTGLFSDGTNKNAFGMTDGVLQWAGFDEASDLNLTIDGGRHFAALHNDGRQGDAFITHIEPKTFAQIAKALREEYLG